MNTTTQPPRLAKPQPVVNPWARPFWDAAKQGRLAIQRCADCAKPVFYPRRACPHCFSEKLEWMNASGRGTVHSYMVVHNNTPSAFVGDIPCVVAVMRFAEGVQMLSNIVQCNPDVVRCDMPVEVVFERLNDEFTLPKFRPAKP